MSVILQKLGAAGLACGGLMLATSLAGPAKAQSTQTNGLELAQTPTVITNESDRLSRLRALQSSVLTRSMTEPDTPATGASTAPLPETRSEAIATATPVNSRLSVSLINNTGTAVTYEVLGDTSRRTLLLNESAMLQDISLPTTITVVRQDGGLVDVAATSSEDGMLEISLAPEPSLDSTQGVIRVQADGQVFIN